MQQSYPIDFIITWVDDSDPAWIAEKRRYSVDRKQESDDSCSRYRDWGFLKYCFRGIEKYTPWVNKVFFVTCGHVPDWLNLEAPKLVHVRHDEYIPKEYLPTFSSHPIELNFHRIAELSEHFVYFNDDTLITSETSPDFFFKAGMPVHPTEVKPITTSPGNEIYAHILLNDTMTVNKYCDTRKLIWQNTSKWFSLKSHTLNEIRKNLRFSRYHDFPGLRNEHLPVPLLKSTITTMWELEYEKLNQTSLRKFRDIRDVNQYLFRYWEIATNKFVPIKVEDVGKYFPITTEDADKICREIEKQHYHLLCLNDVGQPKDPAEFEKVKNKLLAALDQILPEKSGFER